jgi:hypothetical protein
LCRQSLLNVSQARPKAVSCALPTDFERLQGINAETESLKQGCHFWDTTTVPALNSPSKTHNVKPREIRFNHVDMPTKASGESQRNRTRLFCTTLLHHRCGQVQLLDFVADCVRLPLWLAHWHVKSELSVGHNEW